LVDQFMRFFRRFAISLFWRTFILLALLLTAGIAAWVQTFRTLEFEPQSIHASQQIASLVNLSRAALQYADSINRVTLVKTLLDQESISIKLREASDRFEHFEVNPFTRSIGRELRQRLGPDTIVASSVNGEPGLWVGFQIEHDRYWLQAGNTRVEPLTGRTWFIWISIAFIATLLGSAVIAGLINQPLQRLSFAASRIREGEFDSVLDESMMTREIREVNKGFNRMARELAKVEGDRAVMLAGISHDLRTPLARIRLEAEMSVSDEVARTHIADDIDQLDALIDKFMDYARPGDVHLVPVLMSNLMDKTISQFRDTKRIRINAHLPIDTKVLADETDLGRVLTNLLENARRYGRSTDTGVTIVDITYRRSGPWAVYSLRDHGPGAAPEKLMELTTPFFRGDAARTAASGAGLGLAIVEKSLQRMGGGLELSNADGGGLVAHIRLRRAP
jgi:two-component system osmolarity sensor histidine kinase EnvZ